MPDKHLVVSAVNLVEGGTLEVLRQCLAEAAQYRSKGWRVTAIVHRAATVDVDAIDYIEKPEVKRSWLRRLHFEYIESRKLAMSLKPDFWLSLHDVTPNLGRLAGRIPQAVYCHNSSCFYRIGFRESWMDPKFFIFVRFYALLYRLNLKRNAAVIVQQEWIRKEFEKNFDARNVIVAHPLLKSSAISASKRAGAHFFYPAFPRVFKNFELVLRAWEILCEKREWDGELTLTIDAGSNAYQRWLYRRFGHLRQVRWAGRIDPADMPLEYRRQDCLVFASKLESWGLPLSEAKQQGLTILAADLPYAREAVGNYDGAAFFPPNDARVLAKMMVAFRNGALSDLIAESPLVPPPFAPTWAALLRHLFSVRADTQRDGRT